MCLSLPTVALLDLKQRTWSQAPNTTATRLFVAAPAVSIWMVGEGRGPSPQCSDPGVGCLADPPHIEDSGQPAELSLIPGAPLELLCDARGTPTPNITWHKDGQALSRPADSSGAGRVLRVEGVQVLLPRSLWDEAARVGGGAPNGKVWPSSAFVPAARI